MNTTRPTDPGLRTGNAAVGSSDALSLTPQAFEALYRHAWPSIVDYLRFRIGPADAADIASDIFTRAWAARHQFDPARGATSSWLWGITRNAAKDWHRNHSVSVQPLHEDLATDDDLTERGARSVTMAEVAAAVSLLDSVDQDIIALRFGGGLSHREVGHTIGLSEMAAAKRLHRALERVSKALHKEGTP